LGGLGGHAVAVGGGNQEYEGLTFSGPYFELDPSVVDSDWFYRSEAAIPSANPPRVVSPAFITYHYFALVIQPKVIPGCIQSANFTLLIQPKMAIFSKEQVLNLI